MNPVAGIHEVRIGGDTKGQFVSRMDTVEIVKGSDADSVVLVFARNDRNEYRLVGYTRPTRRGLETYALYAPEVSHRHRESLDIAALEWADGEAVRIAGGLGKSKTKQHLAGDNAGDSDGTQ